MGGWLVTSLGIALTIVIVAGATLALRRRFCINWQWNVRNIRSVYEEWRQKLSWLWAPREEKVGLVKAQHPTAQTVPGLYSHAGNASQQLINSDSDLRLDAQGAFTRFEAVDRDLHPPLGTGNAIPPQPLRPAPQPRPMARPRPSPFQAPNAAEYLRLNDPSSAPLTPPPVPRNTGSHRGPTPSMFAFQNDNPKPYSQYGRPPNEQTSLQFDTYTTTSSPDSIQMSSYIYPSETKVPNFETHFDNLDTLENRMEEAYLSGINRESAFKPYGVVQESSNHRYIVPSSHHNDNNLISDDFRYISSSYPGYEYSPKNHHQVRQHDRINPRETPSSFNFTDSNNSTAQTIMESIYGPQTATKLLQNSQDYGNEIGWKNEVAQSIEMMPFRNASASQEELAHTIPTNVKAQGLQRVSQYIQSLPDLPMYGAMKDDQVREDQNQTMYQHLDGRSNGDDGMISGEHKFAHSPVPPPAPPDPPNITDIRAKNGPTTGERIFSALRSVSSQSYIDASEFYNSILISAQQVPKLSFPSITGSSLQLLNKSPFNRNRSENTDYYADSESDIGIDGSKRGGGSDLYNPELNLEAHRTAQEVYNSLQDPPASPLLLKDLSQEPYPYMSDPSFTRTSEDIYNSLEQRRKSMERLNGFQDYPELDANESARRKSSQDLYNALEEVQIMRRLSQSIEDSFGSYMSTEINEGTSRRGSQGPEPEPPPDEANLQRAISCESLCSDTSVILNDLEHMTIVGHICVGLEFERWGGRGADSEGDLAVSVLEARDLIATDGRPARDTLARVCLLPDRHANVQTRIYRNCTSPSYQEKFLFPLEGGPVGRTLLVEIFSFDVSFGGGASLLGEATLKLGPAARPPATTWLHLIAPSLPVPHIGELMISLSYLPTAERLTLVVVKARNLQGANDVPGDFFIKVYILQQGKKMHKKKTSVKRGEQSPTFNEAMIFNIPAHNLQVRLTVAEISPDQASNSKAASVGHVILGSTGAGKSLGHWRQMLVSLRRPVVMWHPLRK